MGWEDILARDYRVEVGTEVGVAEPSTKLMAAVCWNTCLWVREVLERVDKNKFVTSETVPHHPTE